VETQSPSNPPNKPPLSALYLATLVKAAGFLAGVVNILNGYGHEVGAAISSHAGIDKIAFMGSTATGKEVMRLAAGTLKYHSRNRRQVSAHYLRRRGSRAGGQVGADWDYE
jgi:delta 1-pyrroline-5-carboxylate dehydrogenase